MKEKIKEKTLFRAVDVRLLRERLAWVHKRSPVQIQEQINQTLLSFAMKVKEYCKCEEQVFINKENKYACLNCGTRHSVKEDDPKLKAVT